MGSQLFEVPISFHIFNRPEVTKIVFDEIRKIKPKKLFITADGARRGNPDDEAKCQKTREIVSKIDWDCDLYKNFSDTNKGSFKSTSEGITWVFSHVDRAIILEDDCIPHCSFFTFCSELLEYYEKDTRIALISGNNFQLGTNKTKESYYFSRYTHIWGWATWKRTWEQVDFSMKAWPEYKEINGLRSSFFNKKEIGHWRGIYQEMFDKKRRLHWDYLLSLASYMNNTVTILPNVNLVSNVGFGPDASNCKVKGRFQSLEVKGLSFPLKHPNFVCTFVDADDFTEKNIFSGTKSPWLNLVLKFIPNILYLKLRKLKRFIKC
ncbi:MAG: glycosyltransferase family 2 protein [Cycloclasticus sp.]